MVDSGATTARRLPIVPFLAFAVPAIALAWLALASLIPTLRAIAARAPLIEFSPGDMIGLPLALSFLALAAMTLLPYSLPGPRRSKAAPARSNRAATVCIAVAALGALATPVAPAVSRALIESTVEPAYRVCPADAAPRHAPMRWTLPPARCS